MREASRIRRNPAVNETVVDDEIFLVEPEAEEVFYLDRMAGALWRFLSEPRSEDDIRTVFADPFPNTEPADLARDLAAALETLLARNLVVRVA